MNTRPVGPDGARKTEADRALLERVRAWPGFRAWSDVTESAMARLTSDQGIDFATALLYERLTASVEHRVFIAQIEKLLDSPPLFPAPIDALLAVAPGAYYEQLPRAGGDGRLLREHAASVGCRTAVIPSRSEGGFLENGRIICDWLAERSNDRIILASFSKGAADIKAALTLPNADQAFRPVVAWLNLSGLSNGTPISNWLFERRLATWLYSAAFWWKGLDIDVLRQSAFGPDAPLDFPLRLPPHVKLVNVIGFPLRRHLSSKALRCYHGRLVSRGPNDGLMVLANGCAMPGHVYPVWGADHNLRPLWDIRRLAASLAYYLAENLGLWSGAASPNEALGDHVHAAPG